MWLTRQVILLPVSRRAGTRLALASTFNASAQPSTRPDTITAKPSPTTDSPYAVFVDSAQAHVYQHSFDFSAGAEIPLTVSQLPLRTKQMVPTLRKHITT